MIKRSFFNRQSPAVTLLCQPRNIEEAVALAREAENDGADAVAIELRHFASEERTREKFEGIIRSVQLPFMFIDYRKDLCFGDDDEARQACLLEAAEAGA